MADIDTDKLTSEELLALTIYGEARGEPIDGQVAVANVVRNRVKDGQKTYIEVILEPDQFSCWNINDQNYPQLHQLASDLSKYGIFALKENAVFMRCYTIAMLAINNLLVDNTNQSKFYMASYRFNSLKRPVWAKNANATIEIGKHTFFHV